MRYSPLILWHLLSLDAPTVAAVWTWFVARCCGIVLPFAGIAAMFIAVWMLYASDRLLDSTNLEERHHFHHRHRRVFVTVIALAAVTLATLTPTLLPESLRLYAWLGSLLCGWFLMIHTRLSSERRLPKELAVGLFFAAAIFIPTVARRPDLRETLLPPAAIFGAVCALNCMVLYAWEHPDDRSNANWITRVATRHLTVVVIAILIAAMACAPWYSFASPVPWICMACVGSTVLLVLLNRNRARLSPLNLRAAADLALLTPLLLLPFMRAPR